MSAQLFTTPKARYLDANGAPLSGGLLYAYAAGTTTPLDTYTNASAGTPNTNPVVLDSEGYADVWLQASTAYKFVLKDSGGVTQWTVDNVTAPADASATTNSITDPGGRLSLSALVVPTSDVTSAITLFYLPYHSDTVPLYDGTNWALYSIGSSGISQATTDNTKSPAAVSSSSNYDVFVWNDSGVIRLSRGPAWTSSLSRNNSPLTRVDGRFVNQNSITNGPAAKRGLYVGTVHSDSSSQLNDSALKRDVWNMYNRVRRYLKVTDNTASWAAGGIGTFRQTNNSTANQVEVVRGVDEDAVEVSTVNIFGTGAGTTTGSSGVGIDSTSTNSASINGSASGVHSTVSARYVGMPGLGLHTIVWLEVFGATGTANAWSGLADAGGIAVGVAGMTGHCLA